MKWKQRIFALSAMGAVLIVGSMSTTRRLIADNIKSVLVQDVDQPARAPFQVRVQLNGIADQAITIPAGMRLVVDYVTVNASATTSSTDGGIQPVVVLTSTVAGNPSTSFYIMPTQSSSVPAQFHNSGPATIYADTLNVGTGFSGFGPPNMATGVAISGHLITP